MATLGSIQSGLVNFPTSSVVDVTLPTPVDTTKSAIFISVRGTNAAPIQTQFAGHFLSGTTLRLERAGNAAGMIVRWQVCEWTDGVTVQHVSQLEPHDGVVLPISLSTKEQTFLLANFITIGNSWGGDDFVLPKFRVNTTVIPQKYDGIEFYNSNPGGLVSDGSVMYCQVVTMVGADVQNLPFSMTNSEAVKLVIHGGSIDLATTFPILHWRCLPSNKDNVNEYMLTARPDTTSTTLVRRNGLGTVIDDGVLQLVRLLDGGRVSPDTRSLDSTTTQANRSNTLSFPDANATIAVAGGYGGWGGLTNYSGVDDNIGPVWFTLESKSAATDIEVIRDAPDGATAEVDNYAVEFFNGSQSTDVDAEAIAQASAAAVVGDSTSQPTAQATTEASYTINQLKTAEAIATASTNVAYEGVGTTLYVATNGSDSNDGTIGSPLASLPEAISRAVPGDVIQLRGGTYNPWLSYSTNQSSTRGSFATIEGFEATESAPLTIENFPGETVIFDTNDPNQNRTFISCNGTTQWVIIKGLTFQNFGRYCIYFRPSTQNCSAIDCTAFERPVPGELGNSTHTSGHYRGVGGYRNKFINCILIGRDVVFSSSGPGAIGFEFRDAHGETGRLIDAGLAPPESQWPTWSGVGLNGPTASPGDPDENVPVGGPLWESPTECEFVNCLCYDMVQSSEHGDCFLFRYGVDCVLRDSVGYNTGDDFVDFQGCTRCTMQDSMMVRAVTGGDNRGIKMANKQGIYGTVVRNIFVDSPKWGIDSFGSFGTHAVGNTIVGFTLGGLGLSDGIVSGSSPRKIQLVNNLVWNNNDGDFNVSASDSGVDDYTNNLIGDGDVSDITPTGPNVLNQNPLLTQYPFTLDFNFPANSTNSEKVQYVRDQILAAVKPATGSPAIDAGIVYPPYVTAFQGTAPDIGAVETGDDGPITTDRDCQAVAQASTKAIGPPFLATATAMAMTSASGTTSPDEVDATALAVATTTADRDQDSDASGVAQASTEATYVIIRNRLAEAIATATTSTNYQQANESAATAQAATDATYTVARSVLAEAIANGDSVANQGQTFTFDRTCNAQAVAMAGSHQTRSLGRIAIATASGVSDTLEGIPRDATASALAQAYVFADGGTPQEIESVGSCQLDPCALTTVSSVRSFLGIGEDELIDEAFEIWQDGSLGTTSAYVEVLSDQFRVTRVGGVGELVQGYNYNQFPTLKTLTDAINNSGFGWNTVLIGISDASTTSMVEQGQQSAFGFTNRATIQYVNECQIVQSINAISDKIHRYCSRILCATDHFQEVALSRSVTLQHWPLQNVYAVSLDRSAVISVKNDDPTASAAFVEVVNDDSVAEQGFVYLRVSGGGNDGVVEIPFQDTVTLPQPPVKSLQDIVDAINGAVGSWTAELLSAELATLKATFLTNRPGVDCREKKQDIWGAVNWVTGYTAEYDNGILRMPAWEGDGLTFYGRQYHNQLVGTTEQVAGYAGLQGKLIVSYRAGYDPIPADIELLANEMIWENATGREKSRDLKRERLDDYEWERFDPNQTGNSITMSTSIQQQLNTLANRTL